jgi:acetolactate synthase-1/2/3 large subunit
MKLTGAQIVIECLKEQGVDTIFGYPGAAVINIYDELYKNSEDINHILTSHEQGAAHAADGYARSTGKVGVCMATSGPGATNLVTGIATAYMDSVPMVAITGNVPVNMLGKDSFQEVDIQGITMPVTKHNYMLKDVNKLAHTIREAFYIAKSGRPGPVLIDIPKNLTSEYAEYEKQTPKEIVKSSNFNIPSNVLQMIEDSERPMIYAGGGVVRSEASRELVEFAEKINAPVACSLMGIGSIPTTHELYTGMVGMHGTIVSNKGVNNCDLLICIGARFSDRVVGKESLFARKAKIIQIDIDPAEINKNILIDEYAIGDIEKILQVLSEKVNKKDNVSWIEKISDYKEEYKYNYNEEAVNVPYIIKKIGEYASEDTIVCTDVGQHQMWTAQHYPFTSPNKFLTSGGLGTMGYGMGASVGAKLANRDKNVILITGDGSFRMNFNEIVTAVRNGLNVKVFLMNNNALGMVRQWQNIFYDKRFASTILSNDINYVQFANSLGANGYNIANVEDIDETIKKALSDEKVVIVNCMVGQDNNVYPMVPPGKAIDEAICE